MEAMMTVNVSVPYIEGPTVNKPFDHHLEVHPGDGAPMTAIVNLFRRLKGTLHQIKGGKLVKFLTSIGLAGILLTGLNQAMIN